MTHRHHHGIGRGIPRGRATICDTSSSDSTPAPTPIPSPYPLPNIPRYDPYQFEDPQEDIPRRRPLLPSPLEPERGRCVGIGRGILPPVFGRVSSPAGSMLGKGRGRFTPEVHLPGQGTSVDRRRVGFVTPPSSPSLKSEAQSEVFIHLATPTPDIVDSSNQPIESGIQLDTSPTPDMEKKELKPPETAKSSKGSIKSAPDRPARRMRRLAKEKAKLMNQSTARSLYGQAPSAFVIPKPKTDDTEDQSQSAPIFFANVCINKKQVNGCPVYTVQSMQEDRLILRSLGLPHREIIVLKRGSTFNGISLSDFAVDQVISEGDNIVVEDAVAFYDHKSVHSIWRAMTISFPRDVNRPLEKGSRWITQGSIVNRDGILAVDTGLRPIDPRNQETILIKAPNHAFDNDNPDLDVESTVVVRALLSGYAPHSWSYVATTKDSPWTAEKLAIAGGVREGYGHLRSERYPKRWVICAPGLGYVYIPSSLMTDELRTAGAKTMARTTVYYEAILFLPNNDVDKEPGFKKMSSFHKWIATRVKISKHQNWGVVYDPKEKNDVHDESSSDSSGKNTAPSSTAHSQCGATGYQADTEDNAPINPVSTVEITQVFIAESGTKPADQVAYQVTPSNSACPKCMGFLFCMCGIDRGE